MTQISRRALLLGTAGLAAAATVGGFPLAADAATARPTRFFVFDTAARFGAGTRQGTVVDASGQLVLGTRQGTWTYTDPTSGVARGYDYATWYSPWQTIGFPATELIASWNGGTPTGTFVEVALEVLGTNGANLGTYQMGRWASGDSSSDIRRASVKNQATAYATVKTDTLAANGTYRFAQVRLRVRLHRRTGTTATPTVRLAGVAATAIPRTATVTTSAPGVARGKTLAVPTYSQQLHRGHSPQWGGGGAAWCSATSTAMVLDYWKVGPPATLTAWVGAGDSRPQVDHAARLCYDYAYGGTGNWAFNTAYAGARGLRSFVTRLRSLAEAEQFVALGIPVIAAVSFQSAELPAAGYSTNGHLMVIVGFTASGDVVVNDPASHLVASDAQVRVTYPRAQMENVWCGRTGGVAYLMAPWGQRLPASTAGENNWA